MTETAAPTTRRRVCFPGPTSPPIPSLQIDVPEGWTTVPASDVLLAVAAPRRPDLFRANLTITAQRLAVGPSLDSLADRLLVQLRQSYPDLELAGDVVGALAGHPARAQEYAFTEPQVGTLFQIQALLLTPPTVGVHDLIQIHATCSSVDAADLVVPLREMILTLQIGVGADVAPIRDEATNVAPTSPLAGATG